MKWGANICAEIVDNNLTLFASVINIFNALICKPFINKADKSIYSAQPNNCLVIGDMFNSFSIATAAFCVYLTDMIPVILVFFLSVLTMSFPKREHRKSSCKYCKNRFAYRINRVTSIRGFRD